MNLQRNKNCIVVISIVLNLSEFVIRARSFEFSKLVGGNRWRIEPRRAAVEAKK